MFTQKDRELLDVKHKYINYLERSYLDDNVWLRQKFDNVLECARKAERENDILRTKVEIYEKFIARMAESEPDKTNDVYMFDGELYRLREYATTVDPTKPKMLSAEFVCVSNIAKSFKKKED